MKKAWLIIPLYGALVMCFLCACGWHAGVWPSWNYPREWRLQLLDFQYEAFLRAYLPDDLTSADSSNLNARFDIYFNPNTFGAQSISKENPANFGYFSADFSYYTAVVYAKAALAAQVPNFLDFTQTNAAGDFSDYLVANGQLPHWTITGMLAQAKMPLNWFTTTFPRDMEGGGYYTNYEPWVGHTHGGWWDGTATRIPLQEVYAGNNYPADRTINLWFTSDYGWAYASNVFEQLRVTERTIYWTNGLSGGEMAAIDLSAEEMGLDIETNAVYSNQTGNIMTLTPEPWDNDLTTPCPTWYRDPDLWLPPNVVRAIDSAGYGMASDSNSAAPALNMVLASQFSHPTATRYRGEYIWYRDQDAGGGQYDEFSNSWQSSLGGSNYDMWALMGRYAPDGFPGWAENLYMWAGSATQYVAIINTASCPVVTDMLPWQSRTVQFYIDCYHSNAPTANAREWFLWYTSASASNATETAPVYDIASNIVSKSVTNNYGLSSYETYSGGQVMDNYYTDVVYGVEYCDTVSVWLVDETAIYSNIVYVTSVTNSAYGTVYTNTHDNGYVGYYTTVYSYVTNGDWATNRMWYSNNYPIAYAVTNWEPVEIPTGIFYTNEYYHFSNVTRSNTVFQKTVENAKAAVWWFD